MTFGDAMVMFDNREHDFPQQIGYRSQGAGTMLAWIEGDDAGRNRRVEFRYRPVDSPRSR